MASQPEAMNERTGRQYPTRGIWNRRLMAYAFVLVVASAGYIALTPPPLAELTLTDHFTTTPAP